MIAWQNPSLRSRAGSRLHDIAQILDRRQGWPEKSAQRTAHELRRPDRSGPDAESALDRCGAEPLHEISLLRDLVGVRDDPFQYQLHRGQRIVNRRERLLDIRTSGRATRIRCAAAQFESGSRLSSAAPRLRVVA